MGNPAGPAPGFGPGPPTTPPAGSTLQSPNLVTPSFTPPGTAGQPLVSAGAGQPAAFGPITSAQISDRDASWVNINAALTISVPTMGDGVFSAINLTGSTRRFGPIVFINLRFVFTFTFTTAAGALTIGGLPYPAVGTSLVGPAMPNPPPPSPFNGGILAQVGLNPATMTFMLQGTNYVGNFWGPGLGLVSGQQYNFSVGGVYSG